MGKSAWGDIPPINNGRHINKNSKAAEWLGQGRRFVSRAQAEANPELWEDYLWTVECNKKSKEGTKRYMAERKKMKEALSDMLSANFDELKEFLEWDFGIKGNKNVIPDKVKAWFEERGQSITVQDAILLSGIKNAIYRGDLRSIEFIRDTIGEKPKVEVEANTNIQNVQGFNDLANMLYGEAKKEEDKKNEDN